MKIFSLFILFSYSLLAQTTNITVTFTIPNTVLTDLLTWNRTQLNNPLLPTTLTSQLNSTDTTAIVASTTGYPTSGTLYIENEEISYTGITSSTFIGLTHSIRNTTAVNHPINVTINVLKYGTNASLIKALLIPEVKKAILSMGLNSTYFNLTLSTISTNQDTFETLKSTIIQ